jgi:hypothetical protein
VGIVLSSGRAGANATYVGLDSFTPFRFNGIDDLGPAINAALVSISEAGGGTLTLPESADFGMTSEPIVPQLGTVLLGHGWHATRLRLASGVNDSLVKPYVSVDDAESNALGWGISDMFLSGNSSNQSGTSHGILQTTSPTSTTKATDDEFFDMVYRITNIFIHDFLSDGFNGAGRSDGRLWNVRVQSCFGYGFRPGSDTTLMACVAGANGLSGYRISGSSINLGNCKAWGSGAVSTTDNEGAGFRLQSAGANGGVVLSGCEAQDNKGCGFLVYNTTGTSITGLADSNSVVGENVRPGVDLDGATDCDINVRCMEQRRDGSHSYQRYALRLRNSSTNNRVYITHKAINGATINPLAIMAYEASCTSNEIAINGQRGIQAPTFAASMTPDPYLGETYYVTLTDNLAIGAPTNGHYGTRLIFFFTQGGSGSYTVTFNSVFRTAGASFTPTTTVGKTSTISFLFNGTDWIETGRALNT